MTDNAERWRNVAQAAQWLAEGREVQFRHRNPLGGVNDHWETLVGPEQLFADFLYRLAPEPPKPREWVIEFRAFSGTVVDGDRHGQMFERVRVREVIE